MALANWSRSNLSAALLSSTRNVGSCSTEYAASVPCFSAASSSFALARLATTASLLRSLRSPDLSPASGNSTLPGPDDLPPWSLHLPFGIANCPQSFPVLLACAEQRARKCPLCLGFFLYCVWGLSWQEVIGICCLSGWNWYLSFKLSTGKARRRQE